MRPGHITTCPFVDRTVHLAFERLLLRLGLFNVQVPVAVCVHQQLPVRRIHVVCGLRSVNAGPHVRSVHVALLPGDSADIHNRSVVCLAAPTRVDRLLLASLQCALQSSCKSTCFAVCSSVLPHLNRCRCAELVAGASAGVGRSAAKSYSAPFCGRRSLSNQRSRHEDLFSHAIPSAFAC